MTTKPEGVVMWAVTLRGEIIPQTVARSEKSAKTRGCNFEFKDRTMRGSWEHLQYHGYRCIRVTVQPEESRP